MGRITITIAEEVAEKLTKPLKDKITEADAAFAEKVTELMEARVPVPVRKAANQHPAWFCMREGGITLNENGFHYLKTKLTRKVVFRDHWTTTINPTKEEAKELYSLQRTIDFAQGKYDDGYETIRQTLINLRTYKRVEAELPDAYSLLPKQTVTTITVVPKKVRDLVECLVSEDKPCLK